MSKKSGLWLIALLLLAAMLLTACGGSAPEAPTAPEEPAAPAEEPAAPAEEPAAPAEEPAAPAEEGGCPGITIADRGGVPAGEYERLYELADYEAAAGCTMVFHENPDIAALNARITNNPEELPPVEERIPEEPLVVVPYDAIGQYGGTFHALSNATEAGTSDFLSVRHVNLVRFSDDYVTIEPNVAKSWEWNDDFTEITFHLRKGHKWSDGAPFTSADVAFWLNDLVLNPDVYESTPGWVQFGDGTMTIEVIDDTTFKFIFPVPTPGILSFFATSFRQPFQPKHFYEQKVADGMDFVDAVKLYYGLSDWTDVPSPLLSGEADDVKPTLESHILVEETTEGRHFVANPYYFVVDTAGNQLPYINEQDELYVPDPEVRNLKITNGEVDYKVQAISIIDYPLYKDHEADGNYTVDLGFGVGATEFYGFNLTHPDEGLRAIFNDIRFRQAMSLAINRPEIVDLIYLGQAEPMQATPADPNTVTFVTDEQKYAFIEYDPETANALLDEMGLIDVDGDGFRERPDGTSLSIELQYSTQGGPAALQELVKSYWDAVGVRTTLKEVTSDEYRERATSNQADVVTWKYDATAGSVITLDTSMLLPPFGYAFNPGVAYGWEEWHNTNGASGIEPPDDVKKLYDLVAEFLQYPLGSPESDAIGTQIVDIHVNNLWKIGIAGNIKVPIIHHNTLGNFGPYTVVSYDYYRAYPMIPAQWYFTPDRYR